MPVERRSPNGIEAQARREETRWPEQPAPTGEPDDLPEDPPKYRRPRQGTPQGGVLSPRLANRYRPGFDYPFHRDEGPYRWAHARRVRSADGFVILAKDGGGRSEPFVAQTRPEWMTLQGNQEKTRTVRLQEPGVGLDFLGYTFRYDRDRDGRDGHDLNRMPREQSLPRGRDRLPARTDASQCFVPIRRRREPIDRRLRGGQGSFSQGRPREAYRDVDSDTLRRRRTHLGRRSQRAYQKPEGVTWWAHLQRRGGSPRQKRPVNTGPPNGERSVRAGGGKSARPVRGGRTERLRRRSVLYSPGSNDTASPLCLCRPSSRPPA